MLIEFIPDPHLAETVQRAMTCAPLPSVPPPASWPASFSVGDYVRKTGRGGCWRGKVVGWYRSSDTQEGYVVESAFEPGSTHIYPARALEPWDPNHSTKADQAE